ncbi:hypothetical protein CUMW_011770, partial [Citrus unshiu]
MKGFLF